MEALQEQIITLLGTVITILAGYAVKQLKTYLDKKGVTEQIKQKQKYVDIAVDAMQQMYEEADGDVKLEAARQQLLEVFDARGIHITDVELNMLIESAVKGMKQGLK